MTALLSALLAAVGACEDERILVGIDGPDAAGKTTLAQALAAALAPRAVLRCSVDSFHRPAAGRRRRGALSPDGCYRDSYDYCALVERLLVPFAEGAPSVVTAVHDLVSDRPHVVQTDVPRAAVLVVEGVFLLRPELRRHWTLSCHLRVSEDEVLRRAVVRDAGLMGDPAEVERRYRARYLPAQELYRAEADPEARADVVVDNEDPSHPVVRRAWTAAGRGRLPS